MKARFLVIAAVIAAAIVVFLSLFEPSAPALGNDEHSVADSGAGDEVLAEPAAGSAAGALESPSPSDQHAQIRRTASIASQTSARPGKRRSTSSDRLLTEASLLAGSDIDSGKIAQVMRSDERFEDMLERMGDDMRADPDAADLGEAYSQGIEAQTNSLGDLRLDRLACGLRLCAGRFSDSVDPSAWDAWRQRFDADALTPYSVFVEREVVRGGGRVERRIIFATDPTSSGVHVSVVP